MYIYIDTELDHLPVKWGQTYRQQLLFDGQMAVATLPCKCSASDCAAFRFAGLRHACTEYCCIAVASTSPAMNCLIWTQYNRRKLS